MRQPAMSAALKQAEPKVGWRPFDARTLLFQYLRRLRSVVGGRGVHPWRAVTAKRPIGRRRPARRPRPLVSFFCMACCPHTIAGACIAIRKSPFEHHSMFRHISNTAYTENAESTQKTGAGALQACGRPDTQWHAVARPAGHVPSSGLQWSCPSAEACSRADGMWSRPVVMP